MRPIRIIGPLLVVAAAPLALITWWPHADASRQTLSHSSIEVTSRHGNGTARNIAIRTVRRGALTIEEVEIADGTWKDCGGDCAETYRTAKLDFWNTQRSGQRE
ncbi:MAG: hypothetical protein AAFZ01_01135 [Pseudomonadota bacterium]